MVVAGAFSFSVAIYVAMMSLGYLTFGGNSAGFILNNYSGQDLLATIARIAVGGSIVTGYPFTFSAMRIGLMDLAGVKESNREKIRTPLTLGLLAVISGLSLLLKDVGFVMSLSGAIFGSALIFVFPAIMNIANTKLAVQERVGSIQRMSRNELLEVLVNYVFIALGAVMAVIGVSVSVARQFGKI